MSIAIDTSQVLKTCLNKGSRVEINHLLENFSWWGQAFVSESSWSIRQCSDLGRMDCLLLEVWLSTSFTKYRLADIRSSVTLLCICSYSCELWQCVCVCACVLAEGLNEEVGLWEWITACVILMRTHSFAGPSDEWRSWELLHGSERSSAYETFSYAAKTPKEK